MALLKSGSRGPAVSTLQAALNFYVPVQPLLAVDSIFGPKTLARVVAFQRGHALNPDGIVGPKTEAVLFACGSINVSGFAVRQSSSLFKNRLQGGVAAPTGVPPLFGQSFQLPTPTFLQQVSAPLQLVPPLVLPFLPPPQSKQLGPGQQVTWQATASNWEFWTTQMMVLSRPLKITVEIQPEAGKGSTPTFTINVVGTAKWTVLPERLRTPSIFLQASAQSSGESLQGGGGLGFEFKGNSLKLNFERNPAFDVDPEGRARSDTKVPESNFKIFFEKQF